MQGSSLVLWFDTFAELRGVSGGTATSSANVAVGRGDAGETRAAFVWEPNTTPLPDDGFNVIVPTAMPGTGCWKRLHNFEFNVKLFGALGRGTTDDSPAIRRALRALELLAPPNGGGELYFPPGTYLVSQEQDPNDPQKFLPWCLNLPDKVMLRGSGRGATVLKLAPNQGRLARILSASFRSGITIRDLTIDGDQSDAHCPDNACEQQHGVFLDACRGTVIQDVAFQDTRGDSIYLHGDGIHGTCTDTVISGCLFTRGRRVHVHAFAFTNLTITGCHFSNSRSNNHVKQEPDAGLASSGASVTGCTFDGDPDSNGVLFAGHDPDWITTDIAVSGNVFRNLKWGVAIGTYTQGWSIVGNTIENCKFGIQNVTFSESPGYTGNSHIQISGNLIRNLNVDVSVIVNGKIRDGDNFPIFLSNCTVGSIHGNTVYAPQTFQGIKVGLCSKVSVSGNTIFVRIFHPTQGARALTLDRCNNCSATANLIDLPAPADLDHYNIGVVVSDISTYISTNVVIQNNLVLGSANPAIKVDEVNPSANVAVVGNLSPAAIRHLSGRQQFELQLPGPASGVYGVGSNRQHLDGTGALGVSDTGAGVRGESESAAGVVGISARDAGVFCVSPEIGMLSWGGWAAGYFFGAVHITGTLSKAGGGFRIDHPLEPSNKYLRHSFVESPEMKNIYDGIAICGPNGEVVVELPAWFEALNADFCYHLTPLGLPAPDLYVAAEIKGNRFKIGGGRAGLRVSWQVTGIRRDAWAKAHRFVPEEDKVGNDRGHYLHPQEHGQPPERGIGHAHYVRARNYLEGGRGK